TTKNERLSLNYQYPIVPLTLTVFPLQEVERLIKSLLGGWPSRMKVRRSSRPASRATPMSTGWPSTPGDFPRALRTLKAAHDRHPGDRDVLEALAMVSLKSGDREAALRYAKRLVALAPEDPRGPQLLKLLLR
ncbi:MAG: tetratricopeptide repeat protein, partial [Thermoanaerobaculia bacterium]